MPENQKYYYMRLKDNFFDSEEMKLLESMPEGYLYSNILLKLYLLSLKDNGRLCFKGTIPYSPEMIAGITRHQVGTVKQALQLFRQMELIEVLDSGVIYMLNIQNFIGQSSTEADRKKEYRNRIESEKRAPLPDKCPDKCPDNQPDKCPDNQPDKCPDNSPPEIRDKRLEYRYNNPPISPQGETPKPKKKAEPAVPDYSQTDFSPAMIAKMNEWLDYKAEKRQAYQPTGLKLLIAQIGQQSHQHGEAAVMQLMDACMAANYQGIIWDKLGRAAASQQPTSDAPVSYDIGRLEAGVLEGFLNGD